MTGTVDFDLDAKYRAAEGGILLNGVQALVRVLFDQLRADRRRGLRTAAFVSGYPGSPLGGFDLTLQRSGSLLAEHDVHWVPGVNEDLAATSVWGSQQDNLAPLSRHDGVIGMWYGKAPGVDRCGDVFRHANLHGVGRNGGVVCAAGDDPQSKSSTLPSSSETAFYDAGIPVLAPGTMQQVLELGRHAFELSRYSGCWTALKIVTAVADGFGSASVVSAGLDPVRPDLEFDGEPWEFRQVPRLFLPETLALESELYERRHVAARAYAAANGVDRVEVDPPDAWITILSYGHTYGEVRQALADLGLASDAAVRDAGIRLVRLGMIYPIDPSIVQRAARGVEELLVVEEKRSFVERGVRDLLYGATDRPVVVGKRDEHDRPLVPVDGELSADRIAPPLRARLARKLDERIGARTRIVFPAATPGPSRSAAFCSGCPHNRSTVEASGSPVGGGVGCHAMVMWLDRGGVGYSHMGGEGAQWIGRAPFTEVGHFVQNVGDGTFFHSGSLAVRAAVSAGVTMTFKLLYNGVIAMTGGQDPAGQLDVPRTCALLAAEGVSRILVVSDDPGRYSRGVTWPKGTEVWGRDRLAEAERALARTPGVTVLVYDQACAAELRRLRKRGRAPERTMRVVINEAVCEGCGDCGVKSNCLSVYPVETDLGRKTQIHQSSCNTDYSCLDGDCPSFVTVHAPKGAASSVARGGASMPADVPEPASLPPIGDDGYHLVAAGIGGTGVVTLSQVLATAAFLEGLQITGMDQTGLSQKGGPVVSHLVLSRDTPIGSNVVGGETADLLLALDPVVASEPRYLVRAGAGRTITVASTSVVPTAGMVRGDDALPDVDSLLDVLAGRSRQLVSLDTVGIAEALFGDAIAANLLALGAAYQAGAIPVSGASIETAIQLNGVAVERNLAAFRAGRAAVHDPAERPTRRRAGSLERRPSERARRAADELVADRELGDVAPRRAAELVDFQHTRLASRYLDLVADAAAVDARLGAADLDGSLAAAQGTCAADAPSRLTRAVADAFFHVLAYKDEYEVGRLHLLPEFREALSDAVPGATRLRYRLHPPVLRSLGMHRKIALPASVAHPAFRVLRSMRKVRGTKADVFGYTKVRRAERALAAEYEAEMRAVLPMVTAANYPVAVALARLPLEIRGYEEIKLAGIGRYEVERSRLAAELQRAT